MTRGLALRRPGDRITLRVVRGDRDGDEPRDVEVVLGDRAKDQTGIITPETVGLTCMEMSEQLRAFLGVGADVRGVVVQSVDAGSAAQRAGLVKGDVITGGTAPIRNLDELNAVLASAERAVVLRGFRRDPSRTMQWSVSLPAMPSKPR
jgi:S1-C subfamily serine protease